MKRSCTFHARSSALAHILFLAIMLGVVFPQSAFASYPGEQLLNFAATYIIAPLGIFALIIALAGSFFRPDMVKSAIYGLIICAILFFVIREADTVMTALRSSSS